MTMTRFGPLSTSPEGLILGDPGRKHLLLTPPGVSYRAHAAPSQFFAWNDIEGIVIELPTSRFRFPALVVGVISWSIAFSSGESVNMNPNDGAVTIFSRGHEALLDVGRHHVGGYWRTSIVAAQRLCDRFIAESPSRELLNHPEELLRAVIASARR
ncbi:hypothetical protein FHX49_001367 [Microbacterium endophyticum]|uniref:Uncharacterized protein n=2 Tax=Microbacterium endophyticum TaxID=1526412 RepID=A0A7W4V3W1_9MICO|nr:hypothetical protein [Microbacterium endophyticum]MBB2975800.1 hypothetical protein [Microbacterium endophyticum]NIK36283.1 hypothetical protein [Microbacterium endophyticum]